MLGEAGDVGVERELDAVLAQVVVEQGRHVGIENRQDVVAVLHHGHLEPAPTTVTRLGRSRSTKSAMR